MLRLVQAVVLVSALDAAAASAQSADTGRLLTKHPWCSSVEDRAQGSIRHEEMRFGTDGALQVTQRSESRRASSGASASASSSASRTLRWRTERGDLLLSDDGSAWRKSTLEVRGERIVIDGRELGPC
jgi:hypothetical protein